MQVSSSNKVCVLMKEFGLHKAGTRRTAFHLDVFFLSYHMPFSQKIIKLSRLPWDVSVGEHQRTDINLSVAIAYSCKPI